MERVFFESDSTGPSKVEWGGFGVSGKEVRFCCPSELGIQIGSSKRGLLLPRGLDLWVDLVSKSPMIGPGIIPIPRSMGLRNFQGAVYDSVIVWGHFFADGDSKGHNMGLEGVVVDGIYLKVRCKLARMHGEVDEAAAFWAGARAGEGDVRGSDHSPEKSAPWR